MSRNQGQSNVRDEIQKQDANLIDRHASIVKGIKLSRRQTKPTPMQLEHPIMSHRKGHEPQQQDQVVEDRAPQEEISEWEVIHAVSRHDRQWQSRGCSGLPGFPYLAAA
jgi:hypothetical protein